MDVIYPREVSIGARRTRPRDAAVAILSRAAGAKTCLTLRRKANAATIDKTRVNTSFAKDELSGD